jgi:hypothetical protein
VNCVYPEVLGHATTVPTGTNNSNPADERIPSFVTTTAEYEILFHAINQIEQQQEAERQANELRIRVEVLNRHREERLRNITEFRQYNQLREASEIPRTESEMVLDDVLALQNIADIEWDPDVNPESSDEPYEVGVP